jgi:hypothetical protein
MATDAPGGVYHPAEADDADMSSDSPEGRLDVIVPGDE